jgi:hypothetical protein
MLNRFSSATRKINRVIAKINPNNLVNSDLTGSLLNIQIPSTTKYQSKTRQGVFSTIVNETTQTLLTSSLLNIELPSSQSFQAQTRSNPNPITLVNNTNTINDFHAQIFEYSARYAKREIDEFDSIANTLTIKNALLDYGTEDVTSDNFEILLFGLHIPGDFSIKQDGDNIVVILNDYYIDFDNVTINDIYVYGKFVDIILDTENLIDLTTEDGEALIIE